MFIILSSGRIRSNFLIVRTETLQIYNQSNDCSVLILSGQTFNFFIFVMNTVTLAHFDVETVGCKVCTIGYSVHIVLLLHGERLK